MSVPVFKSILPEEGEPKTHFVIKGEYLAHVTSVSFDTGGVGLTVTFTHQSSTELSGIVPEKVQDGVEYEVKGQYKQGGTTGDVTSSLTFTAVVPS
ncbi:IPT/TIG domain-containing protein [Streptomyces sp. LE64]|uniref:IPT/TIG domain-containing protein n=1 Tax=Streptomyces sp. LE64 TaxID=3448653 RepID=UPI004041DBF8